MEVNLLYGSNGLIADFPEDRTTVVRAGETPPIADEMGAVLRALREPIASAPLRDLAGPTDHVAIVFSDITRAVPYRTIFPPLLQELSRVPVPQVVFINALGSHRSNTQDELVEILGAEVVERYRIEQHDSHSEEDLVPLGRTASGNEIWVNRTYMQSSVRILTGLIEPHLFAGFSGGPKAVLPGIAGIRSIAANHGAHMIGHPGSGFGRTQGNPIWEEMMEVALMTEPTFLVNVTQTEGRGLSGVFAGRLAEAHAAGVDFARRHSVVPVDRDFEVVVTTAGGYPFDISMYQSVKGVAAAGAIVKDGGAIVLASECREGVPSFGEFGDILRASQDPDRLLGMVSSSGFFMQDQWDAQILAQIVRRADLHIYSDGLSEDQVRQTFGRPCEDISGTVRDLLEEHGPRARVAVLPAGPLSVPFLNGSRSP
ncbi:MAG TPA: nickel-dependent lactate racemase [Anaerolineales bacterium]|nr:nickel-dependent lactate racemase [Anaerolineales bacterium]